MIATFWLVPAAGAGAGLTCLIIYLLARHYAHDRRTDTHVYNPDTQRWEKAA